MSRTKIVDEVLDNPVEAPEVSEEVAAEAPEVVEEAPKVKGKSVSVFDTTNTFVREYSEVVHGKEFATLAAQFATKKGYSLK